MMKFLLIPLLLATLLSGCVSRHYVEREANELNFYLQLPNADSVQFSSSTDNYVLHQAKQNSEGIWQITIPAAAALKYFYVVDGSTYLPECSLKETDDFGSENCLYQP